VRLAQRVDAALVEPEEPKHADLLRQVRPVAPDCACMTRDTHKTG
jgi:hypothetical protein